MLWEAISLFFLIFTSLFGISALLKLLAASLFGKSSDRILTVLPVAGQEPALEDTLRGLLVCSDQPIAVVNFGLDSEAQDVVSRLTEHFDRLMLIRPEELTDWVTEHRPDIGNFQNESG